MVTQDMINAAHDACLDKVGYSLSDDELEVVILAALSAAPAPEGVVAWLTTGGDVTRSHAYAVEQSVNDPTNYPEALAYALSGSDVIAPADPTREMTMAGAGCLPAVDGVFGMAGALAANVYRAMLAAAPSPDTKGGA